jgi:tetratricopeptide (TPR) repeat protein
MVRLLRQAQARPSDPELLAGLVITCRYCGLLDESVAAYERAQRLDPSVHTSVANTFYALGEYEEAIDTDLGDAYAAKLALFRLGRIEEAIAGFKGIEQRSPHQAARLIARSYRLVLEGNVDEIGPVTADLRATGFRDPEGLYLVAGPVASLGQTTLAFELLESAVNGGFHCHAASAKDSLWDSVRSTDRFRHILQTAEIAHRRAFESFEEGGGPQLLQER